MARKIGKAFLYIVVSILLSAALYHRYLREPLSAAVTPFSITTTTTTITNSSANYVIHEDLITSAAGIPLITRSPPPPPRIISTTAIFLPDWEVLVIVSPETPPPARDGYSCLFHTGEAVPARFSRVLPYPDRATFSCILPRRARRRLPYRKPVLSESPPEANQMQPPSPPPPLVWWNYMAYDSLTTQDDVVLFVKGVNTRQGTNRDPAELRCVFGDDGGGVNSVRTNVTSSNQEVFRCKRPELTALDSVGAGRAVKITLEIVAENRVVPTVAYYTPPRKLASSTSQALLCAATMVYNVAKFLREWVYYHSKIGVDKFIFYDNGSDDGFERVSGELKAEGFDINTYSWRWPKTQEAGFSHGAIYAGDACKWMMFLDVDEFLYSPAWANLKEPSRSLLDPAAITLSSPDQIGQIMVSCREFGPSGQRAHPAAGVTQGYTCRRRHENRHKSVVLLSAVDDSLLNVIHHFELREGYRTKKVNATGMVVNHYKYQAWPEFKAKFRRRVSAYVLDWTKKSNKHSHDRTPGLGYDPVEPQGWAETFCEVRDEELKDLVLKWFGSGSGPEVHMAWQR